MTGDRTVPVTLPGVIAFCANGVRPRVLEELEKRGVHLVLCKTCLDSFGILDKVRVGVAQVKAGKVVSL